MVEEKEIQESFFTVQRFMVKELNLRGLELMTYAIIYGFCERTKSHFYGSQEYLADLTGSTSRGIRKVLTSLQQKGLIKCVGKKKGFNTDMYTTFVSSSGTKFHRNNVPEQAEQSSLETGTKFRSTPEQSSDNNIVNNIDYNIVDNKECHSSNKSASVNEEAKRLSLLLLNLHRQVDPKFKTNNIDTWAADIDKINRLDKRSYEDIEKVIRWVKTPGNFWFANIMSGKKLRLQFDRLIIEITSNRNYKQQKPIIKNDVYTGNGEDW